MAVKFLQFTGLMFGLCTLAAQGQTTTTPDPTVPMYGICGGIACVPTCVTTCVDGAVCVVLNEFWSQCQPAPSPTVPPTPTESVL
ncbi:hypothetical protein P691DRAFT_763454 [Macrolepiota fuliginosa MF-IS2]|uniref:CBM1 domain-containing protein n=1 Tax=Macrolepiota fuliginosa MF-IS2 TaxID=1400762 RepID=A0A9P5X6Q4_9AGAR|nr:hypothetical protein P691DRAFT_763454 [Macrolepiota fuliginosa MF-IS2]